VKIGIVGHSSDNIDEALGSRLLDRMISAMTKHNINCKDSHIEIVSGLTNIGVPKLAYKIADKLKYIKVGISAEQAYEVKCGVYPVDKEIIVGQKFGDESSVFIEYIDCLVRVGGGKQSANEVRLFKEKCLMLKLDVKERLIEKEFAMRS
jgi:hypothetical protein